MPSEAPAKFTGMAAMTEEAGKKLDVVPWEFEPKQFTEDDVDIKIECCGICGSCLHTITSGWGACKMPAVVGHEIVGTVVRAGSRSGWSDKIGARVGVGAQGGSCLECDNCKADYPMYCTGKLGMVGTYQGTWEDGTTAQGGYADFVRTRGKFAVAIPKDLPSTVAAPMLCAGITTYRPLKRFGAGPGKKVAIVGIGGLGHLGLLWSSAMGAETYAISHSDSKKQDAAKLGVNSEHFIIASDIEATVKQWKGKFDIILCTSFQTDMPLDSLYLPLLKPEGTFALVGLPEKPMSLKGGALIGKGVQMAGSIIGGPELIEEMLNFAVEKNVRTWVETRPMKEASQALKDMQAGKARYRYVLVN